MNLPEIRTSEINCVALCYECYEPDLDDNGLHSRLWESENKIVQETIDGGKDYFGFWKFWEKPADAVGMWKRAKQV